jgi:hypothetical protein
MRKKFLGLFSVLAVATLLPCQAFAQEEEASAEASAPAAPLETAQAEESEAAPEPATDEPPAAEPAEEESGDVAGWFRVDHDVLGLQLWFGATHTLGGIDWATDIYINSGWDAEFDIGPVLTLSDTVTITPMVGIAVNWGDQDFTTLVAPQFFTIANLDSIYIEQWTQGFFRSMFTDGKADDLYLRNQIFFKLSDHVALGPQIEATLALNDTEEEGDDGMGNTITITTERETLASLPVGLGTNLHYGKNNTLGLFLGVETVKDAQVPGSNKLAGRFTFVRTW